MNGNQPGPLDQIFPAVPGFTPDSSKFVYVASQGGRQFFVVDEDESNGFSSQLALQPILSTAGHRISVIGIAPNGKKHVIIDGQDKEYGTPYAVGGVAGRCYSFDFSSDGTSYAFVEGPRLNFDGQILPGIGANQQYVFIPDSKHIA